MERVRRIETWARIGYAARGLVYLLLGYIALTSNKALSTGETVQAVEDLPAGTILLALLAVGLFGYGFYKIYSAAVDLDGHGSDAKGRTVRTARTLGGLGYWILCFIALSEVIRSGEGAAESGQSAGSGGAKQEAATEVAQATGGDTLLVIVGLAVVAVAASQFWIAFKAKFMDGLAGAPPLVKPAGQAGYAARAVVIAIVGWFIIQAGMDGERIRNFGDALATIRKQSDLLFQLIAIGLILFGLVSLVIARFRTISNEDVVSRLSAKVQLGRP
jgi:tellurite resistance protein TehA-like permease